MKIVLDTNVLVSAFVFPGGAPEHVYRLVVEGRIELVTSAALLTELGRVLSEKFDNPQAAVETLAQIATLAAIVEPVERVEVIEADPDDDRVHEAAAAAGADVIVSGDRHLLRLQSWRGIRVVAPSASV